MFSRLSSRVRVTRGSLIARIKHGKRFSKSRRIESQPSSTLVEGLPDDIFLEIIHYLETSRSCGSLLSICLLSKHSFLLGLPALYRSLYLDGNAQVNSALTCLGQFPARAIYFHELVIRTNQQEWSTEEKPIDEDFVSDSIEELAITGRFRALVKFEWHSRFIPSDTLWSTLRTECSQLRLVGCKVLEYETLESMIGSELFNFRGLTGFILVLKKEVRSIPLAPWTSGFRRMWEMLLHRCPNLETLVLDGGGMRNLGRVAYGHWPNLRSLTLGYFDRSQVHAPFLEYHTNLRHIFAPGFDFEIEDFLGRQPPALESLEAGMRLLHLPSFSATLRNLDLTKDVTMVHLARHRETAKVLKYLRLESLCLKTDSRTQRAVALRPIFLSCPYLRNFELASSFPIRIVEFSPLLSNCPHLHSFVFSKSTKPYGENITASAVKLFTCNRSLKIFELKQIEYHRGFTRIARVRERRFEVGLSSSEGVGTVMIRDCQILGRRRVVRIRCEEFTSPM